MNGNDEDRRGRTIHVESLALDRGSFRLGPLTATFDAGSRTAVVGPSGCGKSTLLRLLAGLDTPDAGKIWAGETLFQDGKKARVRAEDRHVAIVFQDGALWPHLDADAHLRFVAPRSTSAERREWLQRVGLGERVRSRPAKLSGGERQRLALARALIVRPSLLLLDEPLASVDLHLRDDLALVIRDLAEEIGSTVVHVTHDRDEALAVSDSVVVLEAGRIVEQGDAQEILHEPRTAFAASFLAGATLFPLRDRQSGKVRSPFGEHDLPSEAAERQTEGVEYVLAALPGDVVPGIDGVEAEILSVRRDPAGRALVTCRLEGRPLTVLCETPPASRGSLRLQLRGEPRLLPRAPVSGSVDRGSKTQDLSKDLR